MDLSNNENNIEFVRNSDMATCFFTQGKFKTKIRKLAEKFPNECQIVGENTDGSIVAHFPVKWIHISKVERKMTEEQRKNAGERLRALRENTQDKGKFAEISVENNVRV